MDERTPDAVDDLLDRLGFDPERSVLTRRQAEVLALREHGHSQREIATHLGTSRANISSIEASARRNVENARETISLVDTLSAPVHISIAVGTDLFDVPSIVYDRCDEADTKVAASSAEVLREVRAADVRINDDETLAEVIAITVSRDGSLSIEPAHSR